MSLRDAPGWVYRAFVELNDKHFAGKLPPVQIFIGMCTSMYVPRVKPPPSLPPMIWISRSRCKEGREAVAADLLHEMVHHEVVAVRRVFNDGPPPGHGPLFAEVANRIGRWGKRFRRVRADGSNGAFWPDPIPPGAQYA